MGSLHRHKTIIKTARQGHLELVCVFRIVSMTKKKQLIYSNDTKPSSVCVIYANEQEAQEIVHVQLE